MLSESIGAADLAPERRHRRARERRAGFEEALAEAGIAVPGTVAVAGFDDIPIARYVAPALTTMRVHIADLGRRAFSVFSADGRYETGPRNY